ncbi:MAG: TraR/DksA C4-type zinc finger protein [Limnochordia bacterium]|jgi:YteA family regulatory protein
MDKRQLQAFRRELERQRRAHRQSLETFDASLEESLKDSLQELSTYDQHSTDLGAETAERSKDLGLRDRTRLALAQVEEALERMDAGDYGICKICGQAIDYARLEAIPEATTCFPCQRKAEEEGIEREEPVEEAVLATPFARTFTDGSTNVGYDGEDVWQELERYGTANSPQDMPGAIDDGKAIYDGEKGVGLVELVDGIIDEGEGSVDPIFSSPRTRRERGEN